MTHDYSEHREQASTDQVALLWRLAQQLKGALDEVTEAERVLAVAQARVKKLREQDVPELMNSLGMKEITTDAGVHVELREEVRAALPKDTVRREAAFQWLKENGHIGLVKHEIVLKFTREERALADKIAALIKTHHTGANMVRKDDIHHQTLCAFLREQLRQGNMSPETLPVFGAFIQKFAEVGDE